jgi:hypothetical protein
MFAVRHLATLALAASFLAPIAARADDDINAPYRRVSTLMPLCGRPNDNAPIKGELCKKGGYDTFTAQLDKAIQAATAKAPANVRPLLKRDQAFFYEMIAMAAEEMAESDKAKIRQQFDECCATASRSCRRSATASAAAAFWANGSMPSAASR